MALTTDTLLGHYRIVNLLGVGGMGEVYKAADTTLDRPVALKILPPHLVEDPDRVRRFVQEAKSASALNHPHIVTIYEIGQVGNEGAAGPQSGTLHYIAMEFIEGTTLHSKIHREKADLKKLIEYLAQAADGLAKAHAVGIVHRDLKPENIMITEDGYSKILDFGLAKLVESKEPDGVEPGEDPEEVATAMMSHTRPGMVMGTIGYMSPEQVQGKAVDQRSDIFSFGCILYEAATRQKPFSGESIIDSLHKIVYSPVQPIRESNPDAPVELQRIIRKCLAKEPAERYQSIKDVAIDLKELAREYHAQPTVSGAYPQHTYSGSHSQPPVTGPQVQAPSTGPHAAATVTSSQQAFASGPVPMPMEARPSRKWVYYAVAIALVAAVALGVLYYLLSQRQSGGRTAPPFDRSRIAKLTTTGRSLYGVISPDGKLVAHIVNEAGKQSLYIRQVSATGNTQVIPPDEGVFKGLSFSRDGDFLYYVKGFEGNPISSLYKVPSLGGSPPVKVLDDVDSPITFSPDGKRFAFVRGYPQQGEVALLLINVDGTGEQKLAVYKGGGMFVQPSWSPDGKTIACSARKFDGGFRIEIVAINVADGSERTLGDKKWSFIAGLDWVSDGKSLLASVREQSAGAGPIQVYEVPYPEGPARRVTNDLNNYSGVSLTADSSAMVTVQANTQANLWVAPAGDAARAQQVTTGSGMDASISFAPDGKLLYVSDTSGNYDIWLMDADGKNPRQLTSDGGINMWPSVSPDNRYVIFGSNRGGNAGSFHIWRMNIDGSSPKQLTNGDAEYWPVCSADSKWVIYTRIDSGNTKPLLWKVPIEGGDPVQITTNTALQTIVSPDGKTIATWYSDGPQTPPKLAIMPIEGGQPIKTFAIPPSIGEFVNIRWTPDGKAISYIDSKDGVPNIWNQPIDGGPPRQVTNFTGERIFTFDWSPDGKSLSLSRGKTSTDVIVIRDEARAANTQ